MFNVVHDTVNSGWIVRYAPNDTNFSITESTLEQQFPEEFGREFDENDANVLISTARYLKC